MVQRRLQRPMRMRHTLRAAHEPHLLADVVPAFPASSTHTARNAGLDGYAIANLKLRENVGPGPGVRKRIADLDDRAAGLMAESEWMSDLDGSVCVVCIVVQVGAAERRYAQR